MKIKIDEQGYITEFAIVGELVGDSIEVKTPDDLDFMLKYESYRYDSGTLIYDAYKHSVIEHEIYLTELRETRQRECFSIINRGVLWYSTLAEDQVEELAQWYQDWLDVTDTLVIPTTPEWIK